MLRSRYRLGVTRLGYVTGWGLNGRAAKPVKEATS